MKTDALRLADRMQHIGMSPTMKGTMEAEKLRRQGIADVVGAVLGLTGKGLVVVGAGIDRAHETVLDGAESYISRKRWR